MPPEAVDQNRGPGHNDKRREKGSNAMSTFDAEAAARWVAEQHALRAVYQNLPTALAPRTVDEAYAAQEALHRIWSETRGPVSGLKIATTTKVMQALMGIDHPCGGAIFESRIHTSPARCVLADYINVVVECELAVRLVIDLPARATPWTRETVRPAISTAMAAFELIEDRHAVYRETNALSLIADNAWNTGIVLGKPVTLAPAMAVDGIEGRVTVNGGEPRTGRTDDPLGALAWVANLAVERGRPLKAGQVVITGSVLPTFAVKAGDEVAFSLQGLGDVRMTVA
jgi:2-keto-4-pentenoate hydratase